MPFWVFQRVPFELANQFLSPLGLFAAGMMRLASPGCKPYLANHWAVARLTLPLPALRSSFSVETLAASAGRR